MLQFAGARRLRLSRQGNAYLTATVTGGLVASPTLSRTNTEFPAAICTDTRQFTCKTPEIWSGAAPTYRISAGAPPIWTETGRRGLGSTTVGISPSEPGGSVWPAPVA